MTATSYVTLDNDDLGANKIFRAATASALDTNPVAIAQRGTGAPWLNGVGAIETITSGSGNWTVPDGVYRIKVTVVGGGGGGYNGGSNGVDGGNTTFGAFTGSGGKAGNYSFGAGGAASGGDLNISGGTGYAYYSAVGGGSTHGYGGAMRTGGSDAGYGYGSGGAGGPSGSPANGGGGGGTAIGTMSVEPGDLIAYSIGSGGSGGSGSGAGASGIIIIEY